VNITIQAFYRPVVWDDWERYDTYRYRVRRVHFSSASDGTFDQLFGEVLRTRPMFDIFPNLVYVEVSAGISGLSYSVLFMQPTVKKFVIRDFVAASAPGSFLDYCTAIVARMPNLVDISIPCRVFTDEGVVYLTQRFQNLSGFSYSGPYAVPPHALLALSTMPHLRRLALRLMDAPVIFPPDAFPSLSSLHLFGLLDCVTAFIGHPFSRHLTCLSVGFPEAYSDKRARDLISMISVHCQLLAHFSLCCEWPMQTIGIPFDAFRPLLSCCNMESLFIKNISPLEWTADDIAELGKSWPLIETLDLSFDRQNLSYLGCNWSALFALAEWCPRLKNLFIYINGEGQDSSLPDTYTPFKSLSLLDLDESPISDVHAVSVL
jgi:hypothetical protein